MQLSDKSDVKAKKNSNSPVTEPALTRESHPLFGMMQDHFAHASFLLNAYDDLLKTQHQLIEATGLAPNANEDAIRPDQAKQDLVKARRLLDAGKDITLSKVQTDLGLEPTPAATQPTKKASDLFFHHQSRGVFGSNFEHLDQDILQGQRDKEVWNLIATSVGDEGGISEKKGTWFETARGIAEIVEDVADLLSDYEIEEMNQDGEVDMGA